MQKPCRFRRRGFNSAAEDGRFFNGGFIDRRLRR
jgi:hypothetical protein